MKNIALILLVIVVVYLYKKNSDSAATVSPTAGQPILYSRYGNSAPVLAATLPPQFSGFTLANS